MRLNIFLIIYLFPCFIYCTEDTLKIVYNSLQITVDGNLDEWKDYNTALFSDTLNELRTIPELNLEELHPESFDFSQIKKPLSRNRVEARFFWNSETFNIAFIVRDDHLFCERSELHNKPMLHLNDGVELYIDTKAEAGLRMDINDYQFIIDIENNRQVYRGDRKLIIIDSLAVPKDFDQNVLFHSAVKRYNHPDKFYIVEISIPFAAVGMQPSGGDIISLDLCCNDIDYPATDAVTMEFASTNMWAFNWNGFGDFGYPKYWRIAKLTGGPGWFERITEEYKANWFYIYISTLILSLVVVWWLIFRYRRLKAIPHFDEIAVQKIKIIDRDEQSVHQTANEKILSRATDLIAEKKSENINSENLAGDLGISLRNFQRITKEELKITPTQYIQIIKLRLAAEFLSEKRGNITDASYEHGFSDPSYFSKMFKKHFGLSPLEYSRKKST